MESSAIHIAAYSVSGHTRDAAERLGQTLDGGAVEAIRPTRPPTGLVGYLRMAWAAITGKAWPIETPGEIPEGCRLLVLGTPLWAGRLPPPVKTYVTQAAGRYPAIAVLVTHGGSDPARLLAAVAELSGKAVTTSVAISDEDRKNDRVDAKIDHFAADLRRLD